MRKIKLSEGIQNKYGVNTIDLGNVNASTSKI